MNTYYLDQRETPRIIGPVKFSLHVIPDDARTPAFEVGERNALDVSEGGLKVHIEHDLPEAAVMEVRLRPRGGHRSITQFGRVRWKQHAPDRRGFDVGIQFLRAAPADQEAWIAYVRDQLDKVRS